MNRECLLVYLGCESGQTGGERSHLPLHSHPHSASQIQTYSKGYIRLLIATSFEEKISRLCVCAYVKHSDLSEGSGNDSCKMPGLPYCTEQVWPIRALSVAVPPPAFFRSPTPNPHGHPFSYLLPVSAHMPPSQRGLPWQPYLTLHSKLPCPILPRPLPILCFLLPTALTSFYGSIPCNLSLFIIHCLSLPQPPTNQCA